MKSNLDQGDAQIAIERLSYTIIIMGVEYRDGDTSVVAAHRTVYRIYIIPWFLFLQLYLTLVKTYIQ